VISETPRKEELEMNDAMRLRLPETRDDALIGFLTMLYQPRRMNNGVEQASSQSSSRLVEIGK
jgi:hypothetical protein